MLKLEKKRKLLKQSRKKSSVKKEGLNRIWRNWKVKGRKIFPALVLVFVGFFLALG